MPRKGQRDELYEKLVALFWPSGVARRERSHVNGILEGFRDKGATPEELQKRYDRYRKKWPTMALKAEALFNNWDVMAPPRQKPNKYQLAMKIIRRHTEVEREQAGREYIAHLGILGRGLSGWKDCPPERLAEFLEPGELERMMDA